MKKLVFLLITVAVGFILPPATIAATSGAMSTSTLLSLCRAKDPDPDIQVRQYLRCTDYLSGTIDMIRLIFLEKNIKCLPSGFTFSKLMDEMLSGEKYVPNPDDLIAAQYVSITLTLNHGCPLIPPPSY